MGGFGLSWGISGFRGGVRGKDSGFRIDCTNLRPPLKRTDFANRIDFTRFELRAAPLKRELSWAPRLRLRTLSETFFEPPLNRRFKNIRLDEISA